MTDFRDMMRRARRDSQQGDWAPEPGIHTATVLEGDAFESRAGVPYAKTKLALNAPGTLDDGNTWDHLMGFGTPQQQAINAGQLSVYGLTDQVIDNLEDLDDLAREMAELAGTQVEVTCTPRQNGDGVWTSVNSSQKQGEMQVPADTNGLKQDTGTGDKQPAAAPEDDDIPF